MEYVTLGKSDLKLTDDEIKALEEYYESHALSGVMAQNTPSARTTEQVWIKNGKYVKQEGGRIITVVALMSSMDYRFIT